MNDMIQSFILNTNVLVLNIIKAIHPQSPTNTHIYIYIDRYEWYVIFSINSMKIIILVKDNTIIYFKHKRFSIVNLYKRDYHLKNCKHIFFHTCYFYLLYPSRQQQNFNYVRVTNQSYTPTITHTYIYIDRYEWYGIFIIKSWQIIILIVNYK